MVSKEDLQEIAKRAGISVDALSKAISSDIEEKLELPEVHSYTEQELVTLKDNISKEAYTRGKEAGVEMKFKELRDRHGLEIEGKDMDKLFEKYGEKILAEAKTEPSKKINELTQDLEKLRLTLKQTEEQKNNELSQYKSRMDKLEIETLVKSLLPEKAGDLEKEDLFLLYTGKHEIRKTETGFEIVDLKTNEVLKDKSQSPIKIQDDISKFMEGRKIPQNGRGGKDEQNFSTGIESLKTRTQGENYCDKNNIPLHERSSILLKAMKSEGFDMAR